LQTGEMNWEKPAFKLRPVSSPVLVGDLIMGTCGDGGGKNTVVAIKPSDKPGEAPEVLYTKERSISPYVPSLCTAGNLVFMWTDRGIVSCMDAPSGNVHWTKRIGGNFYGSPVRVGDRLYAMSTDGDVIVLAASDKFEQLAKNSLGESTRATPAISGGRMYLRTDSHLISLGGKASKQTASTK
jgi:outer membrane protein assembly factor BamB